MGTSFVLLSLGWLFSASSVVFSLNEGWGGSLFLSVLIGREGEASIELVSISTDPREQSLLVLSSIAVEVITDTE